MKKQFSYFLAIILSAGLFLTSCKKESTDGNSPTTDAELKTQADDQQQFSSEVDDVTEDANASLENNGGSLTEKPQGDPLPIRCGATVTVDTANSTKTITITYSGPCINLNHSRTGSVVLTFPSGFRWSHAGAAFTVTYNNLKITRKRDNKSITINGTTTITNVSGGIIRNLATSTSPVIHDITSDDMSITFDNGATRSWKVAKRRTFTYDNGIVISVTGTHGDGIAEWGTNRFGKSFTTTILLPLVIKQSCNFRLVSGKVKHEVGTRSVTTTFGLDVTGNILTTCPLPLGSFYLKVEWVGANGASGTVILPY